MEQLISMVVVGVIFLVSFALLGFLASRLYVRSSQEKAYVRTGLGKPKVVMSGGSFVIPMFQDVSWVNRKTLRLPVTRENEQSLITRDRLRVDVTAEFYVRVGQTAEAISIAAQTLGPQTNDPAALKALVEAKFVDGLRAAAAQMTMDELHEKRSDFVQNVKAIVSEDLAKNGLELESASLTSMNQTNRRFFEATNAFDAEGLLKLTREIESRNKNRNEIEQDTMIEIETKNLDARKKKLLLEEETAKAELENNQKIAAMEAARIAAVAETEAEGRRKAEEANLQANQKVAQIRITTEQQVAEAEAKKDRAIKTAKIEADTEVQLRAQQQIITVAEKSKQEAEAKAAADRARVDAVVAEEAVQTAKSMEVAKRELEVSVIKAQEAARKESIQMVVQAEAEKTASVNQAESRVLLARAERDAAFLNAEAIQAKGEAESAAVHKLNEAKNILNPDLVAQQVKLRLIEMLPEIIEQSVKPMQHIDSIKIAQIGGLNAMGQNGGGSAGAGENAGTPGSGGSLSSAIVNSALQYRVGAPMVDSLLEEVGLKGGLKNLDESLASLGNSVVNVPLVSATPKDRAPEVTSNTFKAQGKPKTKGDSTEAV